MPNMKTGSASNKKSIVDKKNITIGVLAAALAGVVGLSFTNASDMVKGLIKGAIDNTSKSDSEESYDALYLSNAKLDVNSTSNLELDELQENGVYSISEMMKLTNPIVDEMKNELAETIKDEEELNAEVIIPKGTLDETFYKIYNADYINEESRLTKENINIAKEDAWKTLVDYESNLYLAASYTMVDYSQLSRALYDGEEKAIESYTSRLNNKRALAPNNLLDSNSYVIKTYGNEYNEIIDKQAKYIKEHSLTDKDKQEEVKANVEAFCKLAQSIVSDENISENEGTIICNFIEVNKEMFVHSYNKLFTESEKAKYDEIFSNNWANYFDNFDILARKYFGLSKEECEELARNAGYTEEFEAAVDEETALSNKIKSLYGLSSTTQKTEVASSTSNNHSSESKTVRGSVISGESTSTTVNHVKPGYQDVDGNGTNAYVTVDGDGNGSASVEHKGGEEVSRTEETKPGTVIGEVSSEPSDDGIEDIYSDADFDDLYKWDEASHSYVLR